MVMTLAQRLNDLAQANADGLLSDDEYRLLRQSAFEQYSGNVIVPLESPIVPTTPNRHGKSTHRLLSNPSLSHRLAEHPQKSPSRVKRSGEPPKDHNGTKLSVTNLIRRATGRNTPTSPREAPFPIAPTDTPRPPTTPAKRGLIPRLFHRKHDIPPIRILTSPQSIPNMHSPPPRPYHPSGTPVTPLSSTRATPLTTRTTNPLPVKSTIDDHALKSSSDIRDAIVTLDNELRGLIDAFNALEKSALRRIKKQNARRLPANTPDSVDVLLEGREWREHRIGPSPSTPAFDPRGPQRYHLPLEPLNDGVSIHSSQSDRTTFSQSRSVSHLSQRVAPTSPLSPHFRSTSSSLQRKTSVSSVSSRSNSLLSSSRLGVSSNSRLSNSSSHLPVHVPKPPLSTDDHHVDLEGLEDEGDQLAELNEIQQRRNEVITRYTQRIEYLKAKQKGAELHERLVRK